MAGALDPVQPLGSFAFAMASSDIQAVAASLPATIRSGRGAIRRMRWKASKLTILSMLEKVNASAWRGCRPRSVE